jgi:aminomethyltransferase
MSEPKRTALCDAHIAAGGKMVDFAGWFMPVNYGSQIQEHMAVRTDAGMFDVSHMTIIDVSGINALNFLQHLVANDVERLNLWGALYGALLNEAGGVIDDLIVYRTPEGYRCVVNASTRDKVLAWFEAHAMAEATFIEQSLSMIAVQGPNAVARSEALLAVETQTLTELEPFSSVMTNDGWMVGRTGYTGEDGVEIMLPDAEAVSLWEKLLAAGVAPTGLGARDTLRLEAGLNLYGQDLDEETSPLASNIAWTIAWQPNERDFIGRDAISRERGQCPQKLTGLIMREKGVLRHGQTVTTSAGEGVITSGTFSPTLECAIALARIPKDATGECQVDIRGKQKNATIVKPPFVRNGKILV